MDRWQGKIAVVTGASSGIGAACVQALLREKMIVIGMARRVDMIEALRETVAEELRPNLFVQPLDLGDSSSIEAAFAYVRAKHGRLHVLINNAGISRSKTILGEPPTREHLQSLDSVIGVNLTGLIHCTAFAYALMAKGDSDDYGHIVNINSVLGHSAAQIAAVPLTNVYPASKFGVTATTEVLRQELNHLRNERVRVTSISPGLVRTEIVAASGFGAEAEAIFARTPHLQAADVAEAVVWAVSRPAQVQVHELILKPVGERI